VEPRDACVFVALSLKQHWSFWQEMTRQIHRSRFPHHHGKFIACCSFEISNFVISNTKWNGRLQRFTSRALDRRLPNSGKYKRSLCEKYSVLWHVKVVVSSTGCAFYLCSDRSQETLQESRECLSFHNNHDRENGPYPLQFWIWNVISINSF